MLLSVRVPVSDTYIRTSNPSCCSTGRGAEGERKKRGLNEAGAVRVIRNLVQEASVRIERGMMWG
jgi:hypothetical protein